MSNCEISAQSGESAFQAPLASPATLNGQKKSNMTTEHHFPYLAENQDVDFQLHRGCQ